MTHHHSASRSRRTLIRALRGFAVMLVFASAVWSTAPADAAPKRTVYYLSVGDSLAEGVQPIGGPDFNHGYADRLLKLARHGGKDKLRLVNLGCGGESTASMIGDTADSFCQDDYDTGSQLGDAVEFLDEHPGRIAFITIDIGANDIFMCEGVPSCFIPQIAANLPFILDTLREHAGPDVPIVGANSYNPFVVDWFDDPAAGEKAADDIVQFNGFLESLYAGASVPVADIESAFAVTDFTTQAKLKHVGLVPLSVYNACTLTWICTGPPRGPDIHPNNKGYRVMAKAFAAVLGV